ncbi:3-oxoacyl-ACP reductase FabG [Brevibacterium sp. H602]|uniref:3-oxoacyl-ACP reductase FabG n=1 Tax=Brevibacterium sp. H602 TaxID=3444316 RepID=UPI003EBFC46F
MTESTPANSDITINELGGVTAIPGLLSGKVAVVTGGGQGLGLAMARSLVDSGAKVVLADMNEESLQAAVTELGGDGVATGAVCNVSDLEAVEKLAEAATTAFGGIDIWVNNAGITRDATIRKMTEQQFDDVISVHLRGTWNGLKVATALMREQDRGGSIINVSSISGKVGNPGQSNYSAAKAGIVGMTKAVAKEVAFKNIRINAIQPGFINTAMTAAMPQHAIDSKLAEIPLGRPGEPEEVASVVLFLASGLSSYLTGTVTEISGGRNICSRSPSPRRGDVCVEPRRGGPTFPSHLCRGGSPDHREKRPDVPAGTSGRCRSVGSVSHLAFCVPAGTFQPDGRAASARVSFSRFACRAGGRRRRRPCR